MKLTCGLKFQVPMLTIYQVLCDGLEAIEGVLDAVDCFHQMENEIPSETLIQSDQAGWALRE